MSVVTPNGSVIQAAMEKERWAPGPVLGWWFFSTPPLPGTYRLEASLPGNLYLSKEMPLNPENLLPLVANPSLIFDQSQMVVRWQPSSGARSYYVELWEVDTEGNLTSQYPLLYTTGLELHFVTVDLGLQPGKRYQARVFAYSADLTDRLHLPDALSSPFNISSTWTEARVLAP
ncbi:fibronectin type III domain-containing protein [Meiothermus sp.]|uniref:fibronectin type III domain-containing protein n=1 Tax=Meiothermus sp. TaxID=1955249 RepID=UPI0026097829|nr:hypothetical protein [Meiothermus sp.]